MVQEAERYKMEDEASTFTKNGLECYAYNLRTANGAAANIWSPQRPPWKSCLALCLRGGAVNLIGHSLHHHPSTPRHIIMISMADG